MLLQLPAVGLRELDIVPLNRRSNGTALSELLDLMPGIVGLQLGAENGGFYVVDRWFIMVHVWFVLVNRWFILVKTG